MIESCAVHGKKDKTTINQDVDGLKKKFTLTYGGGEASFGRETAD